MKGVAMVVLAMIAMAQFMVHSNAIITCNDVNALLEPCLAYLKTGGNPSVECCNGLKRLETQTPTRPDRQSACNCAKSAAIQLQIRQDLASDLPRKCGVVVNVPISANVDCSTVP